MRAGEIAAFETLVLANQDKIYRLCFRMTKNAEDASDLAQEAFLKAYQNLESFKGDSSFSLWLYRLTSNLCIDFLRRAKRRVHYSLSVQDEVGELVEMEIADERFSPEASLEKRETADSIARGLELLGEEHRKILIMRELDGLSYDEIAALLELNLGTVKSRIARARQNMVRFLCEDGNFPEAIASSKKRTLIKAERGKE